MASRQTKRELDNHAHRFLRTQIGELQRFTSQTGLAMAAPLSLSMGYGANPTGRNLLEVNKLIRQAHTIPCIEMLDVPDGPTLPGQTGETWDLSAGMSWQPPTTTLSLASGLQWR